MENTANLYDRTSTIDALGIGSNRFHVRISRSPRNWRERDIPMHKKEVEVNRLRHISLVGGIMQLLQTKSPLSWLWRGSILSLESPFLQPKAI